MKPAPRPPGAGRGARHARITPPLRPRNAANVPGTVAARTAPPEEPTDPEGPAVDQAGFTAGERRLLAAVGALAPALSPSEAARARMRARVLADTATRGGRGRGARARLLVAAAAVLCLLAAVSGTSLVLSRDALPGDPLYLLKRAAETTHLELTFSDTDRGLLHLDYGARRVDELGVLVDRARVGTSAAGAVRAAVPAVDPATVSMLMDDLDAQTARGSSLLTAAGVAGDPRALGSLSRWAQDQSTRLTALRPALSGGSQGRLDGSLGVLQRVQERAATLGARLGCTPITSGTTDELGPLPAPAPAACAGTSTSTAAPVTGAPSTVPARRTAPDAQPGGGAPVGRSTSAGGGTSAGRAASAGGASSAAAPAQPPAPTPSAPGGHATPVAPLPALPAPTTTVPSPLVPPTAVGPILPGLPPVTIG